MRDGDNRVCIGTEFHIQLRRLDIGKTLRRRFSSGTESSLSEDDRRDLWGVYEERQCER